MTDLSRTTVKGAVGLLSTGVAKVDSMFAMIPPELKDPTRVLACLIAVGTLISIAFDLRKKWRDRHK